jgi:trk system potassium uptake protein TrkH
LNKKTVLNILSKICTLEAVLMLIPACVALYYNEMRTFKVFILVALSVAAIQLPIFIFTRQKEMDVNSRDGIAVAALGWIVISFYGCLPFYISGEIPNFVDALFESISGFTTTGSSILTSVDEMTKGMMFWRCFTHWVGGMGVLVLTVAILPSDKKSSSLQLMRAECPGPTVEKLVPKGRSSAAILYAIYTVLTLIMIIFLVIGGMPLYDSVCTTFGTAGTGGFGIRNAGLGYYNSAYIEGVVTVFMMLFGVNFNIYFFIVMKRFSDILKNSEFKVYLGIIATSIALICANTMAYGVYGSFSKAFRYSSFQVSSIMTSTGFATADFDQWPEFSKVILVILMFVGACAGSTGGGFKVSRLIILVRTAKRNLRKMLHPKSVNVVKSDDKTLNIETVHGVSGYLIIYILIFFTSLMIISLNNLDFTTSFTSVTTCFNNIGPGLAKVGPTCNFAHLSDLSKITLSVDMLLGRLECIPIIMMLAPSMWIKKLY